MDAFGKDVVLIETVGVGQSEIEIAEVADTTLVALQPGSGDSVQVLKAGVLEIADVFVVNKSDHPMALQLQREIRSMMEMLNFSGWVPKLVSTQALEGKGVDKLWDAILAHDAWLRESGAIAAKRREAFAHRVRQLALGTLEGRVQTVIAELGDDLDPYAAASTVLERFGVHEGVHAHAHPRPHGEVRAHVKGL
jgi:LAO/AO transport system kinase